MNTMVQVEGQDGYLFWGQAPATLCFVPEDCVTFAAEGRIVINERRYFLDGWSVRNMRWNGSDAGGSHVFPVATRPVHNIKEPGVAQFLARTVSRSRHPFGPVAGM